MVVGQHHITCINALYPLKQHKHLVSVNPPIPIGITLSGSLVDLLIIRRRCDAHHQAEIPVGIEKLVALELSGPVHVIPQEDLVYVVQQHLVMHIGVPSSSVVDVDEAGHVHEVLVGVAPAVEAVVVVAMVPVVVPVALISSETACVTINLPCPHM